MDSKGRRFSRTWLCAPARPAWRCSSTPLWRLRLPSREKCRCDTRIWLKQRRPRNSWKVPFLAGVADFTSPRVCSILRAPNPPLLTGAEQNTRRSASALFLILLFSRPLTEKAQISHGVDEQGAQQLMLCLKNVVSPPPLVWTNSLSVRVGPEEMKYCYMGLHIN